VRRGGPHALPYPLPVVYLYTRTDQAHRIQNKTKRAAHAARLRFPGRAQIAVGPRPSTRGPHV